jgi:hypothetical protein
VDLEQFSNVRLPGLMAQQIDEGDDLDLVFLADGGNSLRRFAREAGRVRHFGTALKLEIVIYAEDKGVGGARGEFFLDEFDEFIEAIRGRRGDAEPADGQRAVRGNIGGAERQGR